MTCRHYVICFTECDRQSRWSVAYYEPGCVHVLRLKASFWTFAIDLCWFPSWSDRLFLEPLTDSRAQQAICCCASKCYYYYYYYYLSLTRERQLRAAAEIKQNAGTNICCLVSESTYSKLQKCRLSLTNQQDHLPDIVNYVSTHSIFAVRLFPSCIISQPSLLSVRA